MRQKGTSFEWYNKAKPATVIWDLRLGRFKSRARQHIINNKIEFHFRPIYQFCGVCINLSIFWCMFYVCWIFKLSWNLKENCSLKIQRKSVAKIVCLGVIWFSCQLVISSVAGIFCCFTQEKHTRRKVMINFVFNLMP